jgi:hypothetical protein
MDFVNRIGYDNFVWWLGVVEDDRDPLKMGRCRVRIFGSHNPNLDLIPTDSLPWASPVNPTNNSKKIDTPLPGEYILGFFLDGLSSQVPVMLGVVPGIAQEDPKTGTGFSPLAREYNNPGIIKLDQDKTPVLPGTANGKTATGSTANNMSLQQVGKPSIPQNAVTANNTIIAWTNSNLVHACDFRFLINLGDLNIGTIENPFTLIEQSIANAKNKAAAMIRVLLTQLLTNFRLAFTGIIAALNLDPTGQVAKVVSQAREVIRTINYYSRRLAEIVGSVALVISLIQELRQVIEWIRTLPSKILALLRDCLTTFQSAVVSAVGQIAALPGQVTNGLSGTFEELKTSVGDLVSEAEAAQVSANIPNTLITIITSPTDANNVNVITDYITTEYPNSNVIIQNTDDATYNVANSSTP